MPSGYAQPPPPGSQGNKFRAGNSLDPAELKGDRLLGRGNRRGVCRSREVDLASWRMGKIESGDRCPAASTKKG